MDTNREKGIAEAKAGNKSEALLYLKRAVQENPQDATAWLWVGSLLESPEKKRLCFEKVLAISPENPHAIKGIRLLDEQIFKEDFQAPPPLQNYQLANQQPHRQYVQPTGPSPDTAFIIELIGGFFGLFGIGYMYAGKTSEGVLRLFAGIMANLFLGLMVTITYGICLVITVPIYIFLSITSANSIKKYLIRKNQHPQRR